MLIMNPSQPDFWTTQARAGRTADAGAAAPRPRRRDRERAGQPHRHRAGAQVRSRQTDINMKYLRNQKLPALDIVGNYDVVGTAGTQRVFDYTQGSSRRRSCGSRSAASRLAARRLRQRLQDVEPAVRHSATRSARAPPTPASRRRGCSATSRRRTCATSKQSVVAQVRDAARQVDTASSESRRRSKARELAEQNLQADEKRLDGGPVGHVPRHPGAARSAPAQLNNELNAIIAYNRALINFEAVQVVPLGRGLLARARSERLGLHSGWPDAPTTTQPDSLQPALRRAALAVLHSPV